MRLLGVLLLYRIISGESSLFFVSVREYKGS